MILDDIVAEKRRALKLRDPAADHAAREQLDRDPPPPARSLRRALSTAPSRPGVIAEFKRRSPSAGAIRPDADPAAIAHAYAQAGAAALSILTDEHFFDGDLAHLAAARAAGVPILRKDFLLDPADLVEARLHGADAALLIVRLLDDAALTLLLSTARTVGLEALVEVHSEEEWRRALGAGATLVGVNHRDLDTLAIDLDLSARIARGRPEGVMLVAESGLKTPADLVLMRDRGFDAVLVGEALMRAPSPGDALAELIRDLKKSPAAPCS